MATKTINLTGAEVAVTGLDGAHAHIRNDGTDVIYAAKAAGISAGADGVLSIPAGQAATVYGISGTVYMLGTGSAQIISNDYSELPFKTSATSGGSGADEVARAAINAHSGNAEIHVTAEEKAAWNGKANLSDIPSSLPANGGNADTIDGKHASDFYQVASGLRTSSNYSDIFSTSLSSDHTCWNKNCCVYGQSTNPDSSDYIDNAPESGSALWYEVFTCGINDGKRAYQIAFGCFIQQRKTFIRYKHDETWSSWYNVSDGGNADTSNSVKTTVLIGTAEICTYSSILDWANNTPSNAWACVISAYGFPTDAPTQNDSIVSLECDITTDRKYVEWKVYAGNQHKVLRRCIYGTNWSGDWFNVADGGNAAMLESHPASDFVLKTDYDALAARVAALEGGTT